MFDFNYALTPFNKHNKYLYKPKTKTMKKTIISFCAIIIINLNLSAQFLSTIESPKKNVAYFELINVYKNLELTNTISKKTFFYEHNNLLYINDYPFLIIEKREYPSKDSGVITIVYSCLNKEKKLYEMTIYYLDDTALIGCMIEKETDMRFGFKLNLTKDYN